MLGVFFFILFGVIGLKGEYCFRFFMQEMPPAAVKKMAEFRMPSIKSSAFRMPHLKMGKCRMPILKVGKCRMSPGYNPPLA